MEDIVDELEDDFKLFEFFDTDKDGKISGEEFMNYLGDIDEVKESLGEDSWQESALLAFKVYDTDTDNFLSQDEFDHF